MCPESIEKILQEFLLKLLRRFCKEFVWECFLGIFTEFFCKYLRSFFEIFTEAHQGTSPNIRTGVSSEIRPHSLLKEYYQKIFNDLYFRISWCFFFFNFCIIFRKNFSWLSRYFSRKFFKTSTWISSIIARNFFKYTSEDLFKNTFSLRDAFKIPVGISSDILSGIVVNNCLRRQFR